MAFRHRLVPCLLFTLPIASAPAPASDPDAPAADRVEIASVGFHADDPREEVIAVRTRSGWTVRRTCSGSTRCRHPASETRIAAQAASDVDDAVRAVCRQGSYTKRVPAPQASGRYSLRARCGDRQITAYDMTEHNEPARLFRMLSAS